MISHNYCSTVLGQLPPRKTALPPNLKLTLTLTITLTPSGGHFSPGGQLSGYTTILFFKFFVFVCSDQTMILYRVKYLIVFRRRNCFTQFNCAIQSNKIHIINISIAQSFNTLAPGSKWFCQIRLWSALRKEPHNCPSRHKTSSRHLRIVLELSRLDKTF